MRSMPISRPFDRNAIDHRREQVREVLEETGFDSSKLVSEQNSLSINCNDRVIKLYATRARSMLKFYLSHSPTQLPCF